MADDPTGLATETSIVDHLGMVTVGRTAYGGGA